MRLRILVSTVLLLLAWPAVAGDSTTIEFDPQADFSRYRTWAWGPGTPAAVPEIEQKLVAALERQLAAAGWTKVDDPAAADVHVSSYASGLADIGVWTARADSFALTATIIKAEGRETVEGSWLVELVDRDTGKGVWSALAQRAAADQRAIEKKIDKTAAKMFADFPPKPKK